MKRIAQGENALIRRNLKKADGTDLLLASLTTLTADIIQNGVVIESLTYPSAKLRQGATTSQAALEVSTTVSAQFHKGRVEVKWTLVQPNVTIFAAELIQKDIITEDILDVR